MMRLASAFRITTCLAIAVACAPAVAAQRADSTRAAVARPAVNANDSLAPPLSPRRAFFYSFLAPGYSQNVLNHYKTTTKFLLFESIALAMIRESAFDVREARRTQNDTIVISWIDLSGRALAKPDTAPIRFGDREVRSRRAHVEDWIAVLVANHLIAGADAYVAAHLWDVPARVALRAMPRGAQLTASFTW